MKIDENELFIVEIELKIHLKEPFSAEIWRSAKPGVLAVGEALGLPTRAELAEKKRQDRLLLRPFECLKGATEAATASRPSNCHEIVLSFMLFCTISYCFMLSCIILFALDKYI